jgi:hypothetical protein
MERLKNETHKQEIFSITGGQTLHLSAEFLVKKRGKYLLIAIFSKREEIMA